MLAPRSTEPVGKITALQENHEPDPRWSTATSLATAIREPDGTRSIPDQKRLANKKLNSVYSLTTQVLDRVGFARPSC
jgi:hypothetical protein